MAKVINLKEENDRLTFTITGYDISYINGLRRIIMSEIKTVVCNTENYDENDEKKTDIEIFENKSRLHNEILKGRLSCIPICIDIISENIDISNLMLEIDVENNTDTNIIVTTKDFKIRKIDTNEYLDDNELKKIFPPFIPPTGYGEYYIDFVRLRPRLSDEIPGEKIKLSCKLSYGTAKQNSSYNVAGTCSLGASPDKKTIEEQLEIRKQKWKDEGKTAEEITYEATNWLRLEALRYVIKNQYDFVLETVGIYTNEQIIKEACNILYKKMKDLYSMIKNDEITIKKSDNTMQNCYDIILPNENYTIGNILNYEVYNILYLDTKTVNYVSFKKEHPHHSHSVLKISLKNETGGISTIKKIMLMVIKEALAKIQNLKSLF